MLFDIPSTAVFWLAVVAAITWSLRVQHPARARRDRCIVAAGLLGMLLAGYFMKFDTNRMTAVAWWINGGLLGTAVAIIAIAIYGSTESEAVDGHGHEIRRGRHVVEGRLEI